MATDPMSQDPGRHHRRGDPGRSQLRQEPSTASKGGRSVQRLMILATSALVLAACSSSDGGSTGATTPSDNDVNAMGPTSSSAELGRIVFVRGSLDGSSTNVFTIEPDGTGETQLIAGTADTPLVSPDGGQIAFECLDGDAVRVCLAEGDGSDPTFLAPDVSATDRATDNLAPRGWSPDGERLVLVGFGGAPSGIFTMPAADGGQLDRVTTSSPGHVDDTIRFSPDGERIVFLRTPDTDDHDADVFVVSADGSDLVRLSPPRMAVECCVAPDWSPDGSRIVFAGDSGSPSREAWATARPEAGRPGRSPDPPFGQPLGDAGAQEAFDLDLLGGPRLGDGADHDVRVVRRLDPQHGRPIHDPALGLGVLLPLVPELVEQLVEDLRAPARGPGRTRCACRRSRGPTLATCC